MNLFRKREAPPVPPWFEKELKMISPNLQLMWMPEWKKFAVVTPVPHTVSKKLYHVEAIIHRDNEFKEPGMDIIHELKARMREKESMRSLDDIPKKMKAEEDEKIEKAVKYRRALQHDYMKKVYHFLTRQTYVMPGEKRVGSGK